MGFREIGYKNVISTISALVDQPLITTDRVANQNEQDSKRTVLKL
jgi:hypothetical protein